MTTRVRTISAGTQAFKAFALMHRHRIRHLVITFERDIVGVISNRDRGGRRGTALRGRMVDELMTPAPVVATPGMTVRSAANLLRGHNIGCLPVLDGHQVVGLITAADLLERVEQGAARKRG